MVGRAANSEVPVPENQELTLECRARKSKPPARIVWYRGRSELKLGECVTIFYINHTDGSSVTFVPILASE